MEGTMFKVKKRQAPCYRDGTANGLDPEVLKGRAQDGLRASAQAYHAARERRLEAAEKRTGELRAEWHRTVEQAPHRPTELARTSTEIAAMSETEVRAAVQDMYARPEVPRDPYRVDSLSAALKTIDSTDHRRLREHVAKHHVREPWRHTEPGKAAETAVRHLRELKPEAFSVPGLRTQSGGEWHLAQRFDGLLNLEGDQDV